MGAVVVAGKKLTNDLRQNFGGGPPFVKLRRIPVKDDVQNQSFPIWHPAADKVDKEAIGVWFTGYPDLERVPAMPRKDKFIQTKPRTRAKSFRIVSGSMSSGSGGKQPEPDGSAELVRVNRGV